MKKIIFLAGMSRSGTTFFQNVLRKNGCVCLGEVGQTIDSIRRQEIKSSYWSPKSIWDDGRYNALTYNDFWSEIKDDIFSAESRVAAIEIVYMTAQKAYPNSIIIDSSKHIGHLNILKKTKYKNRIFVFHILRDFRSWRRSITENALRNDLKKRYCETLRWLYVNYKLKFYLKRNFKEKSNLIYYENFVLNKELERLEEELENVDYERYENVFWEMFGSKRNIDGIRRGVIKYDYRWVCSDSVKPFDFVIHFFQSFLVNENNFKIK